MSEVNKDEIMLEVNDLKVYFGNKRRDPVKAVDGVSFKIKRGQTFGLVGESGSGKTTIGRAIIRLYEPTAGSVKFMGKEISGRIDRQTKDWVTTKMQMIFQDPMASLNPRRKVLDIVAQGADIHHLFSDRKERYEKVCETLESVGLSREHADRYPHQFSGGQRQRIGISRALIMEPELVICDEAISALDISIQAQVVNLLKDFQDERGTTYLFIAHDLAMVQYISDVIGVLHLGHMVEMGNKEEIFENPIHPYTKSLLSAIPRPDPIQERKRVPLVYDYATSGIDYNKGTKHYVSDTHMVLATDRELEAWTSQK